MKTLFLISVLLLLNIGITNAVERINDNCYKWSGVLVCEAQKIPEKEVPQIEPPEKEESPIIKISWEYAEVDYSDKEICSAIWYIEGGEKANQEYGINPQYVKCENHLECEKVCLNTVKNKRKMWNKEGDFLEYLSKKYCPPNYIIWLKNLKFYLKKLKGEKIYEL